MGKRGKGKTKGGVRMGVPPDISVDLTEADAVSDYHHVPKRSPVVGIYQ